MGRHRAPTTHWAAGAVGAACYVGRVGALALALGVGAAVAGGGIASADGTTGDSPDPTAGARSTTVTNAAAGSSSDTDGPDVRPGGLRAALRAPRMAVGTSAGSHETHALAASISALPQRITRLAGGDTTPAPAKVPPGRGTTHGSAKPVTVEDAGPPVERVHALVRDAPAVSTPVGSTPVGAAADPVRNGLTLQSTTPATTLAPQLTTARPSAPIATVVSTLLSAVGFDAASGTDDAPPPPAQPFLGALALISRDIERALATVTNPPGQATASQTTGAVTPVPSPGDVVRTPYGAIGKWMLKTDGDIANWGGQKYFFGTTTLLEPVNVIIVDPNSRTPEESTAKLNSAMSRAGFPAQTGHSTGFMGSVLGDEYAQQPENGSDKAFSDNVYILPNNHLRAFGPAPVAADDTGGEGYVWTGAASTEIPGIYDGMATHRYASFGLARNVLALRMILSGAATFVGVQPMNNVYNDGGVSTGDNDGYAIVLRLT